MLMNLKTLSWDPHTCKTLGIPMEILPKIKASASSFGKIAEGPLAGVPILGVRCSKFVTHSLMRL
jgi:glycerol kinase